jgi:hypothetical protein
MDNEGNNAINQSILSSHVQGEHMNSNQAIVRAFAMVILAACALPARGDGPAVLVEDQSLTLEQYKTDGFPDTNRGWSLDDLKVAAKAMSQLGKQDPSYLPRAGNDQSGKLFARMVSQDPLTLIKKKTDQTQRLLDLTAACQTLAVISRPYMAPPAGKYFDSETTLLAASAARYTAAAMREFSTLRTPGDEADYAKTMDGMARQFDVAVGLLKTGTSISLASRQQLVKDLDPVFRDVMTLLPASSQGPLIKSLQDVIDAETDSDITKKEQALMDWMKRVAKK